MTEEQNPIFCGHFGAKARGDSIAVHLFQAKSPIHEKRVFRSGRAQLKANTAN